MGTYGDHGPTVLNSNLDLIILNHIPNQKIFYKQKSTFYPNKYLYLVLPGPSASKEILDNQTYRPLYIIVRLISIQGCFISLDILFLSMYRKDIYN